MIINITHAGKNSEHSLVLDDIDLDDAYIRSLAEKIRDLPRGSLVGYVIDRMPAPAGSEPRLYVRPKVPFGVDTVGGALCEITKLRQQLDIAVEALLQYSTSPTACNRAQRALAEIAELDEPGAELLS